MEHQRLLKSTCALGGVVLLLAVSCANEGQDEAGKITAGLTASSANLDCTIDVSTDVDPPLTLESHHVVGTSNGQTGTANCTGTVDGETVTGPGTFGLTSEASASSCVSPGAENHFVLRVPTTGGIETIAGSYSSTPSPGNLAVNVLTGDITGTATVTSADGDCVNTPITKVTAEITGHVGP